MTDTIASKTFGIDDGDKLEAIALNAARKQKDDIWLVYVKARCELERKIACDALDIEFRCIMKAYDMILTRKNLKKTIGTWCWRSYHFRGVKGVLETWALEEGWQEGFRIVIEQKRFELTGEYLVLRAQTRFAPNVVVAARKKLINAGAPKELLEEADQNQLS